MSFGVHLFQAMVRTIRERLSQFEQRKSLHYNIHTTWQIFKQWWWKLQDRLRKGGNTNRKPNSTTAQQTKHNFFTSRRIASPHREQRWNNYNIERNQSQHIFKYKKFTNGVQQKHKYTNRNHQERFTKRNETVYIGKRVHQTNRTNTPPNNNIDYEEHARRRQSNNYRTDNFETDDTDGSRRRSDHFLWNRTRLPQRR